jgi:hypothetical protein
LGIKPHGILVAEFDVREIRSGSNEMRMFNDVVLNAVRV